MKFKVYTILPNRKLRFVGLCIFSGSPFDLPFDVDQYGQTWEAFNA